MSKTYAEAIRDCLKVDDKGNKEICLSLIPFERVISGLTLLQIHVAKMIASENQPDVEIVFGDKKAKYKGEANISELAIARLINNSDFLSPKSIKFSVQWGMFITWLLNEKIPTNEHNDDEDFEPVLWYETDTLFNKFNEYAAMRNKEI